MDFSAIQWHQKLGVFLTSPLSLTILSPTETQSTVVSRNFRGVVTVSVPLLDLDINQCPSSFYTPNYFKNTATCDYKSSYVSVHRKRKSAFLLLRKKGEKTLWLVVFLLYRACVCILCFSLCFFFLSWYHLALKELSRECLREFGDNTKESSGTARLASIAIPFFSSSANAAAAASAA